MKRKIYLGFKIVNNIIFIVILLLMIVSIGESILMPENVDIFTCGIVMISGAPILIINRVVHFVVKQILRNKDRPVGIERIKNDNRNI